ncbi:MAG: hypothetical protein WD939_02805 [Dehalococcoidia bacterium]
MPTPTATPTLTPTSTPTITPANTLAPSPTPTPQPAFIVEPPAQLPAPQPEFVSEVAPPPAPVRPPAEPTPVRGGSYLPMPAGTSVVWGGCASDGECHWYNFYWGPTHEVVMQDGEGQNKVQHELCHAHQHWSINGGAPLEPSDYDLESWYLTAEGSSFTSAVAGLPWPWTHSAATGLEDFAWTCGYWYYDAAYLLRASPERYDWAAANLP